MIFMFKWKMNVDTSTSDDDMCLIDSATTYTILKSNKFFSCLVMRDINVSIIYSTTNIWRLWKSYYTYTKKLNRNLLSVKDICLNRYTINTNNEKDMKYLYIFMIELKKMCIGEIIKHLLWFTHILVQLRCMSW